MTGRLSCLLVLLAAAAASFSGCKSDPVVREGIDVNLCVTNRFPTTLVTGVQIVVRSLPGGRPIALREVPPMTSVVGAFPINSQTVDRDGDGRLEYEILIQGGVFGAGRCYETKLFSSQLTTAPFALVVRLLGPNGVMGSALTTTDFRARALQFLGSKLDPALRVELTFDCGGGVPCQDDANAPPVFSPVGDLTIAAGRELSLIVAATDPDGDDVVITAQFNDAPGDNPPLYDLATGILTWTPRASEVRAQPYPMVFTAKDSRGGQPRGGEAMLTVNVSVAAEGTNSAPVIRALRNAVSQALIGGRLYVAEGDLAQVLVETYDPDGEVPVVSAQYTGFTGGTPSFDPMTNVMKWTPPIGAAAAGPYSVTFTATDGTAQSSRMLEIFVIGPNRAPVLTPIGPLSAAVGIPLTFTVRATDPQGSPVTLSGDLSELPPQSGATFDAMTGAFSWTPTSAHITPAGGNPWNAIFTARDPEGLTSVMRVAITVTAEATDGGVVVGGTLCQARCVPGEVCASGVCSVVTTPCATPCGDLEVCIEGTCQPVNPTSCGTCPNQSVCVQGTCLSDRDQDGIPDIFDFCPDLPGGTQTQTDTDGDRIGDSCDENATRTDLALKAGAPVAAEHRGSTSSFKLIGIMGGWSLPTVLKGTETTIRSGPLSLGGATNR